MDHIHQSVGAQTENLSTQLFEREWRIYRKVVDNNYSFHRETYSELHRILTAEAPKPFRFLDLACGDASMTSEALRGTQIAHYHGIDLSQAALDLARKALAALPCPIELERRDYVEAVCQHRSPVDVVWIGFSLHHLQRPAKLALMQDIRGLLARGGLFLMCEPAGPDNEDRDEWLNRFERQNRPLWTALTTEETDAVMSHVRAADFPETSSGWLALGRNAGFSDVKEVLVTPDDLHRMYFLRA